MHTIRGAAQRRWQGLQRIPQIIGGGEHIVGLRDLDAVVDDDFAGITRFGGVGRQIAIGCGGEIVQIETDEIFSRARKSIAG